jgi:hypothetical protein
MFITDGRTLLAPGGGIREMTIIVNSVSRHAASLPASFSRAPDNRFGGGAAGIFAHSDPVFPVGLPSGIDWTPGTFVRGIKGRVPPAGQSVSYSQGSATFVTDATGVHGWAGLDFSISGFVPDGGYVAAALAGSIRGMAVPPVVLGVGDGRVFTYANYLSIFSRTPVSGGIRFSYLGCSLLGRVDVGMAGVPFPSVFTLSLIADPPTFASVDVDFAGGGIGSVPEPSTLSLALIGLSCALLPRLLFRVRRRESTVS